MQALRKATLSDFENKKTQLLEEIMEVVSLCASHREGVQQGLEQVKGRYGRRLEAFLSVPQPPVNVNVNAHRMSVRAPPSSAHLVRRSSTAAAPPAAPAAALPQLYSESQNAFYNNNNNNFSDNFSSNHHEETGFSGRPIVAQLHQTFDQVASSTYI